MVFDFQLLLSTSDSSVMPVVEGFSYLVDVPDRLDSFNALPVPAVGLQVNFTAGLLGNPAAAFNGGSNGQSAPNLLVSVVGGSAANSPVISNLTTSGFFIQVLNGGSPSPVPSTSSRKDIDPMTQNVLQIPTAAPLSGMALVTDVNNALAGLASLCSGGSAPTASSLGLASTAGLLWHDTQANQLKLRNQADSAWIVLGSVNETSGIFVPAAAQVYSPLSAATTLALANGGQFLLCSAALPLTLPATSGLTSAWSVSIFAKGGPVSLSLANGSDALNGSVGGSAIVPKGYYAELVTDAAGNYSAVVIPASLGLSVLASAATVDLERLRRRWSPSAAPPASPASGPRLRRGRSIR